MSTKSLYNWWKVIGTPQNDQNNKKQLKLPNFYPYLTRFEMTELVATRAEILANNAPPRCDPGSWDETYNEIDVASAEIEQNRLGDYHILRRYPHNKEILVPVSELFIKSSY